MKNFKILQVIGFFVASILLIGSFCFIFMYSSYRVFFEEENSFDEEKVNSYEFLQLDFKNNETSLGIVTKFKEFAQDEYSYEVTEEGKHILISNFGSEKYLCHGFCYCEKDGADEYKRRGAAIFSLKKGVVTLLVATTSIVAYQISKNQFDEDCEEMLSGSCDTTTSFIRSDVEECVTLSEIDDDEVTDADKSDITSKADEILNSHEHILRYGSKYLCHGTCMANVGLMRNLKKEATMSEKALKSHQSKCIRMYFEGYMVLERNIRFKGEATIKTQQELAAIQFAISDLNKFCVEKSKTENNRPTLTYSSGSLVEMKKYYSQEEEDQQQQVWCVGIHFDEGGNVRMRESVKCIRVWKTGGRLTKLFQKLTDTIF